MTTPTPQPFYIIEPHSQHVKPGEVDITEIASRVYGKPFDALRSTQQYSEYLTNDQVCIIRLTTDEDYEETLYAVDDTTIYLGYDPTAEDSAAYHEGHTTIQYWQSVRWAGMEGLTKDDTTVEANPAETFDCYGAVFPNDFFAQRHTSPPIDHVLADLVRRGELPRGDFIVKHWW